MSLSMGKGSKGGSRAGRGGGGEKSGWGGGDQGIGSATVMGNLIYLFLDLPVSYLTHSSLSTLLPLPFPLSPPLTLTLLSLPPTCPNTHHCKHRQRHPRHQS